MFNKTTIHPIIEDVTKKFFVTVKEQRAPTDESIRLLKEMEQQAKEKLISSFEISNNTVSGTILFFARIDRNINYRIKFKINNSEISFDDSIPESFSLLKKNDEIIKLFFEKVSERLTKEFISNSINQISKRVFR